MKNRIVFFIAVIILAAVGVFCYTQLEIGETTRWVRPSREARQNPYLALERWLAARKCPVRRLSRGDIDTLIAAPEKTIFVEASAFDWSDYASGDDEVDDEENDDSPRRLTAWVQNGGRLIISIDTYTTDWYLASYLKTLGIEEYDDEDVDTLEWDWDDEDAPPVSEERDAVSEEGESETNDTVDYDSLPALDQDKRFVITEQRAGVDRISVINGSRYIHSDKARLLSNKIVFISLETGKGSVTVMGEAYFLYYSYLRETPNANLAGALFFDGAEKAPPGSPSGGVLFIRSWGNEKRLFGNLAERGNPLPLLAAAIVLIIAGFWMAIPLFGRVKTVPARPGKPLRERFLAEGRFLYKYGALDKYLALYEAELDRADRRGDDKRAGQLAGTAPETAPPPDGDHHHKNTSLRYFMKRQLCYIDELERIKPRTHQTHQTSPQEERI